MKYFLWRVALLHAAHRHNALDKITNKVIQ